jgi:hypothetical protein
MGYGNNGITNNVSHTFHGQSLSGSHNIPDLHNQNFMSQQNENMNEVGSFRAMLADESDDSSDDPGGLSFNVPPSSSSFSMINEPSSCSSATFGSNSSANDTAVNFSQGTCDQSNNIPLIQKQYNTQMSSMNNSSVTVFHNTPTTSISSLDKEEQDTTNSSDQLFVKPEPHTTYPVLNFNTPSAGFMRQSNKDEKILKVASDFPSPPNLEEMKPIDSFATNLPVDSKCTSTVLENKISYDSDWLELKLCTKCTNQLRDSLPEQLKHPKRRKSTLDEFSDNSSTMDTSDDSYAARFTTENIPTSNVSESGASIKRVNSTNDLARSPSVPLPIDNSASSAGRNSSSTLAHLVTVSPGSNNSVQSAPLYLYIQGKVIPVTIGQVASSTPINRTCSRLCYIICNEINGLVKSS